MLSKFINQEQSVLTFSENKRKLTFNFNRENQKGV